jgi:hypothetical protein
VQRLGSFIIRTLGLSNVSLFWEVRVKPRLRRVGAAAFIASAAQHLPSSDVWCILYPSLRNFMKSDIVNITEENLLAAVKSPVMTIIIC